MEIKRKKPAFHFNVGIISFLMIFIYLLGHLFVIFLNRGDLAIYEVIQSRIHDSVQATGVILRDESIVKAAQSGYMNYYVNECQQVAKNGLVYTCDETGQVHDYISNLLNQEENLPAEDYGDLKEELVQFQDEYSDSQFQKVYNLKYELASKAMQISDTLMAKHMDEIEAKMGSGSFIKNYSQESGLVTYLEDGFETKKLSNLKESDFDTSAYTKTELKQSKKIKKGSSVYRLCRGTDWQIVVPLTGEEYKHLKKYLEEEETNVVTVNIEGDDLTVSCGIDFEKKKGSYYGILSMTNYLVRYAKDRYLDVEIEIETEDGLKIPNSAIAKNPFYKIPEKYFQAYSTTQKDVTIRKEDKGKVSYEKKRVYIGKIEEGEEGTEGQGYCYVLEELLPKGTVLAVKNSPDETMLLKDTVELPGVYNVNKGYADFRYVDVLLENKDYTIIRDGVANSVSLFDRIVLNGNTVENNEIIY